MADTAQDEALRWVTAAVASLREAWDPEVGIDAWEAMRSPLFVKALERLRGSERGVPLQDQLRQRLRALAGPKRLWVAPRGPGGTRRADVILWPTELSHVRCQLPVAAELRGLGRAPLFVATKPAVAKALVAGGSQPLYAPSAWRHALRGARSEAVRRASILRKELPPHFPPWPSHDPKTPANGPGPALDLLPAVAEAAKVAETALEESGARLLVVGNDLTLEGRSATLAARARGVPTACQMHGAVTGSPLHAHHLADRFLAFGNASRNTLVQLGIPEARIAVVGAPHSAADRRDEDTHPSLRRLLGLHPGAPWVLIATSGPGHAASEASHQRLVRAFAGIAARHPEVKLVAKLHRKDRPRYYEEATRASKGLFWVPAGSGGLSDDIADWLPGCSLLVTVASSAAVDAMLQDVPVMTVDLDGELGAVDFIQAGATLHVRDEASLEREMVRAVARGSAPLPSLDAARDYIEASFSARGSQAAERAAAALVGLLQGRTAVSPGLPSPSHLF